MFNTPIMPVGLQVELSRHQIREGASEATDSWMETLNARRPEAQATLVRDGMAIEVIFRRQEGDAEYLYWFELRAAWSEGDIQSVPDEQLTDLDREHIRAMRVAKLPGWEDLTPQLVMIHPGLEDSIRNVLGDAVS